MTRDRQVWVLYRECRLSGGLLNSRTSGLVLTFLIPNSSSFWSHARPLGDPCRDLDY